MNEALIYPLRLDPVFSKRAHQKSKSGNRGGSRNTKKPGHSSWHPYDVPDGNLFVNPTNAFYHLSPEFHGVMEITVKPDLVCPLDHEGLSAHLDYPLVDSPEYRTESLKLESLPCSIVFDPQNRLLSEVVPWPGWSRTKESNI